MAIVVEDGTGKDDANSYVSVADLKAYATDRGVDLGTDDDTAIMAVKAMDYINAKRSLWAGYRTYPDVQRLDWPRSDVPEIDADYPVSVGVVNGGENLAYGSQNYRDPAPLPPELIEAQCQLVMQVKAGVALLPTTVSGKFIKRQKIGPIEREFSETVGIYTLPQMPVVDALLSVLYKSGGGPLSSYRR